MRQTPGGTTITQHDAHIDRLRNWISQLMALHNLTASELARKAGLSESTLTRFMNADGPANLPREGTILKIEEAFQTRRPTAPPLGDSCEPGADARQRIASLVRTLHESAGDNENTEAFIVSDHALDLVGYLPDDLVLIDTARRAEPGDVVAVRFRASPVRPGTVTLRIFDQPFLTSHSTDDALRRPLLIDPARIDILGVVIAAMRQRGVN